MATDTGLPCTTHLSEIEKHIDGRSKEENVKRSKCTTTSW